MSKGYTPGIVAAIVVPVCVAVLALVFVIVMIRKERANQPMFQPLESMDIQGDGVTVVQGRVLGDGA